MKISDDAVHYFDNLLMQLRPAGIRLVCFSRGGCKTIGEYKEYLIDRFNNGSPYSDYEATSKVVDTLIDNSHTPFTNFSDTCNSVENNFRSYEEVMELKEVNRQLRNEIDRLKFEAELRIEYKRPFTSLISLLIRVLKIAEKGAVPNPNIYSKKP